MSNITDFDRIRKERNKKRAHNQLVGMIKFICIVFAVVAICYYVFYGDALKEINQEITEFSQGEGYPVKLSADEVVDLDVVSNSSILLTETYVYVYNTKGRSLYSQQHGLNQPFVVSDGDSFILSQRGGNSLKIIELDQEVFSYTSPEAILDACYINEEYFGLITQSDRFQGEVKLFAQDNVYGYSEIFSWKSADYIITDVAVSQDGSKILATTIGSVDGILKSDINIFDVYAGEEIYSVTLPGEMVMETDFKDDKAVILTQNGLHSIDTDVMEITSYDYQSRDLLAYSIGSDDYILLALEKPEDADYVTLVTLDSSGKVVGEAEVLQGISSVNADDEGSYVVTQQSIYCYNINMSEVMEYSLPMGKKAMALGEDFYYTTPTELMYTDFERPRN